MGPRRDHPEIPRQRVAGDRVIKGYHAGYILDASVAVKWFAELGEEERDRALALRVRHTAGLLRLSVPVSFPLEVANALRFNQRFEEGDVVVAVQALEDLRLDIRPTDFDLLRKTVAIAYAYRLTLYDAVYVALAEASGLPLVTADEALLKGMKGHSIVLRLRDLEFP
ncbi:MAG: type II toxin-antitoxin system VapC family toxin [Candidatus Rokubacteria bacterium]|nr:type II toxin-antitoxin system VapC family toxin [Candidatus Rokubacteria bacterium]